MKVNNRTALLIAHPAHELLVYSWLETTKPIVHIMTRGLIRGQPPRIFRSEQLLHKTGCGIGSLFGEIDDSTLYQQLLDGDYCQLIDLTWKLSQSLVDDQIDVVVGDAAEGEILAHDVWRAMINVAIDLAQTRTGKTIQNIEFAIESTPLDTTQCQPDTSTYLDLDASALERKMSAIAQYIEVESEAERVLSFRGKRSIARETFGSAEPSTVWLRPLAAPTNYDFHGEEQVKLGRYEHAIKHGLHVLPFIETLNKERLRQLCA